MKNKATRGGLWAQIGRFWRLIGTGLSFLLFGVGGLVLGLVVFPLLNLLVRDDHDRRRIARNTIGNAFAGFVGFMRWVGVLRYEITGLDRIDSLDHTLIIANHPSLIDVVFLSAMFRQADCVVKAALWRNPFTRGPVSAADYIPNTDPVEVVEECVRRLQAGRHVILFPEGTRTKPNQQPDFKRGAAAIALRANASVLPVAIDICPTTLTKGEPWYHIPVRRVQVTMLVLDRVQAGNICDSEGVLRARSDQCNDALAQIVRSALEKHVQNS